MVNKDTSNEAYPMHLIDKQLEAVAGATLFTSLNLTNGSHQPVLHPDLGPIKSLSSPEGLFQWKVLPLGMKTSGVVFQRIMEKVVRDLQP